jgi:hypothetical protein
MIMGALVFLLALGLRLTLVGHQALWGDELFSLATATGHSLEQPAALAEPDLGDFVDRPDAMAPIELARYSKQKPGPVDPAAIIRATRLSDTSPPLYYLLLAYWLNAFGTGDVALRMFSVVCFLAAFPLIWLIAADLGGKKARLPAVFIYTVVPLSIYLSTEGRMYSLLWLMAALNLFATVRLSRETSRWRWIAALWVVSSIGGLYTHYFFLVVWGPTCLWMLLVFSRSRRITLLAMAMVVILAAAPWYVHLPADMKAWRVTAGWQALPPHEYKPVKTFLRLIFHYVSSNGTWAVRPRWEYLNYVIYFVLIGAAWWRGSRALFSPRRLLLWTVAGSACGLFLASDFVRGTYAYLSERYVAAGLPAAAVLLGIVLSRFRIRPRALFIVLIFGCSMLGFRKMCVNLGRQEHPVDKLAAELRQRSDSNDLVLVHAIPSAAINVARYLAYPDGSDHPLDAAALASLPRIATWVGQLGQKTMPDDIAHLAHGRRQVFLVYYHALGDEPVEQTWLEAHGQQTATFRVADIPVVVYSPRTGDVFE